MDPRSLAHARRTLLLTALAVVLWACDDEPTEPEPDTTVLEDTAADLDDTATPGDTTEPDSADGDTADGDTVAGDTTPDTMAPDCTSNADCSDPGASLCDVEAGRCVECLSHNTCRFGTPICNSQGDCSECETDAHCEAVMPGTTCVASVGICQQCLSDDDCAAPTPLCSSQRQCGECRTPFDCQDPVAPTCVDNPETGAGVCLTLDLCDGDDTNDARSDDGPVGATDLTPMAGSDTQTLSENVLCNEPNVEADWFKVDVADGDNLTLSVDWTDPGVDIDLSVFDADGLLLGESWYRKPELVELSHLPAGPVYVALVRFDGEMPLLAPYSVTATIAAGGCTTDDDCLVPYDSQLLRGHCDTTTGACGRILGDGMLTAGERCDSPGDCASELCGYGQVRVEQIGFDTSWFYAAYMASAGPRAVCTAACADDAGCAMGQVCTTIFDPEDNHCVPACTSDEECPVDLFAFPAVDGDPWHHLSCVDGHCQLDP